MGEEATPAGDEVTGRIVAFLREIGFDVSAAPISGKTVLPGILIRGGRLIFDPDRLRWPGDLLHEAGHIAVTDPALRPTLDEVPDDPGEEMAAIAWSYAATVAIGLDPAFVFHAGAYGGGPEHVIEHFTNGRDVGVPLLHAWDMSGPRPHRALSADARPYPHMDRWLR
ncbi:MAG TPA: hypothetical protein VF715_09525 [Thermoleophilaceae bacterium]